MRFSLAFGWFVTLMILISWYGVVQPLAADAWGRQAVEAPDPPGWDPGWEPKNNEYQASGFWDGGWTDAKSGMEGVFHEENSTGKGFEDKKRTEWFYKAPPRQFENVDTEELSDLAHHRDYAHGALILVPKLPQGSADLMVNGKPLKTGHYFVKLGRIETGSPAKHVNLQQVAFLPGRDAQTLSDAANGKKQEEADTLCTMVLKRLGNVEAVLPITRREPFLPPKRLAKFYKKHPGPMGRLVAEEGEWRIKVRYGSWIFTSTLQ